MEEGTWAFAAWKILQATPTPTQDSVDTISKPDSNSDPTQLILNTCIACN